jgi:multicomponent Na+:H+ antiporter subunit E
MNTEQNRFHLIRLFWFLVFIPVFLWEMLKANIDVAYRVLHPQLPINPGLVKVKTNLQREISLAFLANAISLTPGNTTVDIIGDAVFVHCIDIERPAQVIASRFENIIARIFE